MIAFDESAVENLGIFADCSVVWNWKAWPRRSSVKTLKTPTRDILHKDTAPGTGRGQVLMLRPLYGAQRHPASFPKESMSRGWHDSLANYLNTWAPPALLAVQLVFSPDGQQNTIFTLVQT